MSLKWTSGLMKRSHQVDTKMEIIMEDQIKLDNQVAQYAPILEQGQVGQVDQPKVFNYWDLVIRDTKWLHPYTS